ncbi:MAG: hypothetical protein NTZ24_04240 [Deltaproteobacteria bacterium]|nr:hypothetical protein [Deltaproteobacteria bacterium]
MYKKKLMEKLKVVKDSRERDRIIWALSGLDKDATGEKPAPVEQRNTVSSPTPDQKQNLPKLPAGIRKLFSYVVPAFFLFFGLMNLLQALMHILPSGKVEAAIPQLIMGAIFFLFGIAGFIKARKQASGEDPETKADEPS